MQQALENTINELVLKEVLIGMVHVIGHKPTLKEIAECLKKREIKNKPYDEYDWNDTPLIRVYRLTVLDASPNCRIERLWMNV